MKNGRKLLVKILTVLTLLFGTVSLLQTDFTMIKTAAKLWVLHDNMSFYNEQPIKTNQLSWKQPCFYTPSSCSVVSDTNITLTQDK